MKNNRGDRGVFVYCTNSFNFVWERVCAEILDNQRKLGMLSLLVPLLSEYDPDMKLVDLIDNEAVFISVNQKLKSLQKKMKEEVLCQ